MFKTSFIMAVFCLSFAAQASGDAALKMFNAKEAKYVKTVVSQSSSIEQLKKLITQESSNRTSARILQTETRLYKDQQCDQVTAILYGNTGEVEVTIRDQKKFFKGTTVVVGAYAVEMFGLSADRSIKLLQLTDCNTVTK